jgi:hypothetical protein
MRVTGKVVVDRPPEELWEMLLDPAVLRRCMPGCEAIGRLTGDTYHVELKVGFGLLKGRFTGEVKMVDVDPGRSYTLEVRARGATGFVEGRTAIALAPVDGAGGTASTEVAYEGEAHVGGVLASVGARLFQGAARSFQEEFFRNLAAL